MSAAPTSRRGWITTWDPNDENLWDEKLAWRTLWITTYSLTLGFITWFLVSAIAPKLNTIGFALTKEQLYWLAAMPGLAGGGLRLVWTFLPALLGTRRLIIWSTAALVIPLVGWTYAVQDPTTPYAVLMLLAFLAGIGGGVFSGFMPSTSYFFPKRKQGLALGLQAGIGNFGVSVVQFLTPWLIGLAMLGSLVGTSQREQLPGAAPGREVWYQNAGLFWIPFVLVAVVIGIKHLRSVPVQARGVREQLDIFKDKHTWLMTVLYIMTFGTFSGLSAQFALLIRDAYGAFEGAPDPVKFAFLGPLVGSAARILTGPIADRVGGGILSVVSGLGIAGSVLLASVNLAPNSVDQFTPFLWAMMGVFFFAGVGNASTFKQMPMIFQPRQAGGVIGWTAAIAAFGPFLFGISLATLSAVWFFYGVAAFAVVGAAIAWWYYARPGAEKRC
jgi:MFS transporter, NNP family, nitrate/nitrite transporter